MDEAGEIAVASTEFERICGALLENYQRSLFGPDDFSLVRIPYVRRFRSSSFIITGNQINNDSKAVDHSLGDIIDTAATIERRQRLGGCSITIAGRQHRHPTLGQSHYV